MDVLEFEFNMSSGEFPADYELRYVSFSQLFQSDNLGSQRQWGQREETDWLRDLLSSEDNFDPDFLENLDLDNTRMSWTRERRT